MALPLTEPLYCAAGLGLVNFKPWTVVSEDEIWNTFNPLISTLSPLIVTCLYTLIWLSTLYDLFVPKFIVSPAFASSIAFCMVDASFPSTWMSDVRTSVSSCVNSSVWFSAETQLRDTKNITSIKMPIFIFILIPPIKNIIYRVSYNFCSI